nr:hypothetical protein [Tanacetum cinerariifolium]
DASKHGRISDIDADEGITLDSTHNDEEMFDADQELHESTTTATIPKSKSHDKGKGKMVEQEPVKLKKKDQILLDEVVAKILQAEINEEERLARERARQEQEANIALIET